MRLARERLLEARYRASPHYDLVPGDRLTDAQRALLAGLRPGAGVLVPRAPGLTVRAADAETVALCTRLAAPGALPPAFRERLGAAAPAAAARLVLDGVLGIEWAGDFVSGPEACGAVVEEMPAATGSGRLAELSRAALAYGASLGLDEPLRLSARLYQYNTLPLTPRWRRRFPDRAAVARALGLERLATRTGAMAADPRGSVGGGWLSWHFPDGAGDRGRGPLFKLYVSPHIKGVAAAFQRVAALVAGWRGVVSLKVGAGLAGLLRPDKFVVYFGTRARLDAAAAQLGPALDGMPAQGVPFTAPADPSGMLSWGVDPPADRPVLAWLGVESWRLWITNQLATALVAARAAPSRGIDPAAYALARVSLEGVDPGTWAPTADAWPAPGGADRARH